MADPRESQQLVEAFATFTQVSEQLRAQYEALHGQLARLRNELETLLDTVPFAIWVVGGKGELRFTNRPDGLPGEFVDGPPPWLPGAPAGLRQLRLPDGAERYFEQESRPTEAGQIITLRDITEAHLRAQQATREERLRAMGLMAAELAHEIRNPLGSLTLFAGMLAEDLRDQPPQLELTHRIQEGVTRLNTLVSNTLTFSRDLNPHPRRVELSAFWEEIRHGLRLPPGLVWTNRVPPEAAWRVDPELLRQVVTNLLQNALKAMEDRPEGRLSLGAVRDPIEGLPHWRLVLEDTGCGIPAEALDRVFDPFFTTFGGGTGLGLAVCHRILSAHGGLLYLESQEGHGTKVHLRLPAAEEVP
jgi:signal transduction histidine kinase